MTPATPSAEQLRELFTRRGPQHIAALTAAAQRVKEQRFGRTAVLYAPVYISNYCSSHCTYCGFHRLMAIRRLRLTPDQMAQEFEAVAGRGIENVLLLTGESYRATPLSYLTEAVKTARRYFTSVHLEIHPLDMDDYRRLVDAGVDGVTIYQETYDRRRYAEVHRSGKKADYDYRYQTPQRAASAGVRAITLGVLLGLHDDVASDLAALYQHLRFLEQRHPDVEYALSFPRLRTIKGRAFALCSIDDVQMIQILCLTRLFFPHVGLTLSTRERPAFRDEAVRYAVTKISAGSRTSVGGYTLVSEQQQDPQFDIEDRRSVQEIVAMLKQQNIDPVFTDWRPLDHAGRTP